MKAKDINLTTIYKNNLIRNHNKWIEITFYNYLSLEKMQLKANKVKFNHLVILVIK